MLSAATAVQPFYQSQETANSPALLISICILIVSALFFFACPKKNQKKAVSNETAHC